MTYAPERPGDLGAMCGAIVAAIGGLFALGVASAIAYQDISLVFRFRMLGVACLLISGPIGWLLGGRLGPLLSGKLKRPALEIVGGVFGGVLPVLAVLFLGWCLTNH